LPRILPRTQGPSTGPSRKASRPSSVRWSSASYASTAIPPTSKKKPPKPSSNKPNCFAATWPPSRSHCLRPLFPSSPFHSVPSHLKLFLDRDDTHVVTSSVFVSDHPRPASLSRHHDENPATACTELRSVTPLSATLMELPASVANKRLTAKLTPLDATLTKNRGMGSPICFSTFQRSNVQTCNDPRPGHQIPAAPLFSYTSELPIFYPLCFDIHPCNGGVYPLPAFLLAPLFSLFAPRASHNSFPLRRFHTLSKNNRVSPIRLNIFLKYYFRFFYNSSRPLRQFLRPFLSRALSSALPQRPVAFAQHSTARPLCRAVSHWTIEVHSEANHASRIWPLALRSLDRTSWER
jgi:hypothetical protein